MKVNLEVELDECPYWDYEAHKGRHTCGSCRCMKEGNNLENAELGVRIGDDRYCTLKTNIKAALVDAIETTSFMRGEE